MLELLQRRVLFVGGKGGVGKSTTASALALLAARSGRRCLLVSMDPAHSLGDLFGRSIADQGTELADSLTGLEIDPQATATRHIAAVAAGMRRFVRAEMYGEVERHLHLARSAPGAVEAALLERLADLLLEGPEHYDLLVFDTAPTGHTLRLLSLPEVMATWTGSLLDNRARADRLAGVLDDLGGPLPGAAPDADADGGVGDRYGHIRVLLQQRQERFRGARRILTDGAGTAFILVLNPEKLAIQESRHALESLRRHEIPVAAILINRALPDAADGEFLEQRRRQEQEYLREIRHVFRGCTHYLLPLLRRDVRGMDGLLEIGRLLAAQAGDHVP